MSEQRDYRDTVFLPKTDFPMKAGLPQKEPGLLARWQSEGLYQQVRENRAGQTKFILHDGPPYANGDMHIGHALNHVLKDMVVRTQTLLGKDAPYVPGWDCHGLPIEWKVEEQYRKKKLDKDQVPVEEFRAECRAYAQHWVDTQREQLKRLGINGDWDNPYLTMHFEAEATIVRELLKFAESGQLYRGAKPVMWSPVEKTALAEAEVEYEDITSTQIDVAFEIVESPIPELVGAHAVIWTTTPWTIPANQALAYGPEVEYTLVDCWFATEEDGRDLDGPAGAALAMAARALPWLAEGPRFIVASTLLESFERRLNAALSHLDFAEFSIGTPRFVIERVQGFKGSDLAGTIARHPMHHLGGFYAEPRPFLPGDFVTTDSGTGLVHMAPDHGEDDFELCKAHGISPKFIVEADGRYREDWLWLPRTDERSMSVINPKFNAPEGPVCTDLRETGALLSASTDYQHSYPHSWRSKAKVIFRCTPQWFVPMDKPGIEHIDNRPEQRWENEGGAQEPTKTLRQVAMNALEQTRFVPEKGRNRIGTMVESRPDWVLSRQRAWGVPITLFVDRKTGEYLVDPEVNQRIVSAVNEKGVDAWSDANAQTLLGNQYDAADYERIVDILDVWFDSGSTHAFVLESGRWPDLQWPADLYLEGSDQHRGWFQSSLLESCGTRGRAPYNAVLTHGFTMDAKGEKMSKSKGNTVSPLDVMKEYGADIIRLWALSVDYTEDHRIGPEILKGVADQYRKLRNTFRYLLGALDGFEESERVGPDAMPELERYVLSLLGELDAKLKQAVDDFDFNTYTRALIDFCNEDLSAFYFDIRKDRLYCDAPSDLNRRAYRTVLDTLFQALIRYAAPVMVFTAEEIWQSRYPDSASVHLLVWPEVPAVNADAARWAKLRALRVQVTEAIEPLRREKIVRSSLEAEVTVPSEIVPEGFSDADLAELFISAAVDRTDGDTVTVRKSGHAKCGRCWRLLPEVTEDGGLCDRCEDAVAQLDAVA
ncbi:isoleucine--tRNA ligase [Altererythrobacter sp. Root672]|uniref:isoleucine--tRNA ligase n=1 Tax=Altererythrobacter sp. Root672 TaxID=1736584 RepID=UPI0006FD5A8B|nr:isoleucine--tRNA ligase [Altererythrobacter sp. Root672]KRA81480.1 isoleucine--tRNA ligase [Altererythrobacter sp. Root672]